MRPTRLARPFTPRELVKHPGLYVADSTSRAYPLLRAMTLVGMADPLGERQVAPGVVRLVARVPHLRSNPSKGQVRIGAGHLVNAKRDYNNWREKWWRETIQNAVDAGATRIDLAARELEDGTWLVSCQDNGKGMDEDTILNKFLVLGDTGKADASGALGGFGKAKELIILPWLEWIVHSRDVRFVGHGLDWESDSAPHLAGTLVQVRMSADDFTSDVAAEAFVEKCFLPTVRFTINGKVKRAAFAAGDAIGEVPGRAGLFFTKAKTTSPRLMVRTGGLFMFDRWIASGVPGHVLVELTGRSIELLTANRDGFRDWRLEQAVDGLVNRLAADTQSALRKKKGMIREVFRGTGTFKPERAEAQALVEVGPVFVSPARVDRRKVGGGETELEGEAIERVAEVVEAYRQEEGERGAPTVDLGAGSRETTRALLEGVGLRGQTHLEAVVKQLVWKPDFFLMNDLEGYRVEKRFFPATMKPRVLRLVRVWTELCRFVLIQLGSRSDFGVGLVFSNEALAMHANEEGTDWLLLNPFRKLGVQKEVWTPGTEADLQWLYASAIHECTHLADGLSLHNESFAAALTANMARCANGWRKVKRIVASIRLLGDESSPAPRHCAHAVALEGLPAIDAQRRSEWDKGDYDDRGYRLGTLAADGQLAEIKRAYGLYTRDRSEALRWIASEEGAPGRLVYVRRAAPDETGAQRFVSVPEQWDWWKIVYRA